MVSMVSIVGYSGNGSVFGYIWVVGRPYDQYSNGRKIIAHWL